MSLDTSPVSICSNALLMLGASPINSFDENTERAMLCSNIYPIARDSLLREHPWSFAVKRILLAKDKEAPLFDYKNAFTLPSDYLRVLSVGERDHKTDYVIESMKVLANVDSLKLIYVFQNTDVATYDSASIDLLTALVAAKTAYAVTQSTSMAQFKLQEYELKLKKAKTLNGMEAPNGSFGAGYHLLEGRFNG